MDRIQAKIGKKMKTKKLLSVAFFLPSLAGGGAERNIVNLLKNINKKDYLVSLVLAEKEGDFLEKIPEKIEIVCLKTKRKAYFKIFLRLIDYFKKENPDIIISAFPHFNIICLLAKKISKAKTKIIITEHVGLLSLPKISSSFFHGIVSKFLLPIFVKIFYPKADAIICVSKGVADDLHKIIKKDMNFVIIYNPIDIKEIEKLSKEKIQHKWFLDKKISSIVMAGRLIAQKDYATAFLSLAIVNKKRDARMVILGRGAEEKKLKNISEKLGLSEKIAFMGFQKNPYKYISKSSIFVLSSIIEGFGNVIVESMACGVPVVSTNCPFGPDEIIENNKSGILVPVKNPELLADAILRVLGNPSLKKSFIKEGKSRAEDFSAETIIKQYEKVINELK